MTDKRRTTTSLVLTCITAALIIAMCVCACCGVDLMDKDSVDGGAGIAVFIFTIAFAPFCIALLAIVVSLIVFSALSYKAKTVERLAKMTKVQTIFSAINILVLLYADMMILAISLASKAVFIVGLVTNAMYIAYFVYTLGTLNYAQTLVREEKANLALAARSEND